MSRAKILLVDDEPAFLAIASTMLREAGYECDTAGDGHEALLLLPQNSYDVLISDREMPGNDRFALLRNLPASCASIPVIILTAYPSVDSAIDALQLSVVAYVVKPVDRGELLAHVARAIELGGMRRAVGASREHLSNWSGELGQLERVLEAFPNDATDAARQTLFSIHLDYLGRTLDELRRCAESAPSPQQGAGPVAFGLRSEEQLALLQGLRETISMLEKTKNSFKSRELGQLRRRLESLFEAGPRPTTTPPPG